MASRTAAASVRRNSDSTTTTTGSGAMTRAWAGLAADPDSTESTPKTVRTRCTEGAICTREPFAKGRVTTSVGRRVGAFIGR